MSEQYLIDLVKEHIPEGTQPHDWMIDLGGPMIIIGAAHAIGVPDSSPKTSLRMMVQAIMAIYYKGVADGKRIARPPTT